MGKSNEVGSFLSHYGVKGMKWGVTNERAGSPRVKGSQQPKVGKDWVVNIDGSIDIQKGATLSRVVRNHSGLFGGTGAALDSGAPIYAAFKPADVAGYEHFFGRQKSLLVKEASVVLQLEASNPLKAPGPKESAEIYYNTLKQNPKALAAYRAELPALSRKGLDRALEDPTSQKSYGLYSRILDAANYNPKGAEVNALYFAAIKKAGYNMLLDPSDAFGGFDAPVMVLDGGKNLTLSAQRVIDKASAEKARLAYKSTSAKQGKLYLEKLGYL